MTVGYLQSSFGASVLLATPTRFTEALEDRLCYRSFVRLLVLLFQLSAGLHSFLESSYLFVLIFLSFRPALS